MVRKNRPFDLSGWRIDPEAGTISRDGTEARLEPQLMDLLLLFAANPGRTIAKDEIVAGVWKGRAIGDDTLAAAISRLRAALGETRDNRFIETLPKRGYRLAATFAEAAAGPAQTQDEDARLIEKGLAALKAPAGSAQARLYFEEAIARDPANARAHEALAHALLVQHLAGAGDIALLAAAKASAQAALALDVELARAHATLGFATLLAGRDFDAADDFLRRAVAKDGELAFARRYRAFGLASVARFVEAEREIRKAIELEPLALSLRGDLTQILLLARRYGQAILEAKRTLALAPQSSEAYAAKGWAHHFLGDDEEAHAAFLESLRFWGADAKTLAGLTNATGDALFAVAADLFDAHQLVFRARPTDVAILRANAGDFDAALRALEQASAAHDPYLLWVPHMPHLDRLRNDRRFVALMERLRPAG